MNRELIAQIEDLIKSVPLREWRIASNECRWNIVDDNGVDVALAQQSVSVADDLKQLSRSSVADYIAAVNPAVMAQVVTYVRGLEQKLIRPLPIGELLQRLEDQTGEPWGDLYLAAHEIPREG